MSTGEFWRRVGEQYEQNYSYAEAMDAFRTAANLYKSVGSITMSNGCLLKVARYAAQLENYDRAIAIYEQIAYGSSDNNQDWFLRAGLCQLANADVPAARRDLDGYLEFDDSFSSKPEAKFLEKLVTSCENSNCDTFTRVIREYDSDSTLDQWITSILLRIKRSI